MKHIVVLDNKDNLVASITVNFETQDLEIISNKEYDARVEGKSVIYGGNNG